MKKIASLKKETRLPDYFLTREFFDRGDGTYLLEEEFEGPFKNEWKDRKVIEVREGVCYWESRDAPISHEVMKDKDLYVIPGTDPQVQHGAYGIWLDGFLEKMRELRSEGPTAEEKFQALAAFGPGASVLDVITGHRFET